MFNYNLQYDLVELVYNWAKSDNLNNVKKFE